MKQFLASNTKYKALIEWQSLKLSSYASIHKYVDKFWDLNLKTTVYKKIDFEEQKQQFCVAVSEDMKKYVNSQRPKTILAVIHHTMVAARINFQQGAKRNIKPMEMKDKHEPKGKNNPQHSSKGTFSNNKDKEKGVYKGKNMLTPKELEHYRKDNKCFKCVEQGHTYHTCPQRNVRNEQPKASMVEAPKEDIHCKVSPLSYAWGNSASSWQSLSVWRQRIRARSLSVQAQLKGGAGGKRKQQQPQLKWAEKVGWGMVAAGAVVVAATLAALLPVLLLGGLALLVVAFLTVAIAALVCIGITLYFVSRSERKQRASQPQGFTGTSFHMFQPTSLSQG
ncbi:hypothetical protein L7F22_036697 [Adiantum nelumboides]|nr:hypothetical protein [Adiantum nelumboides]